MNETKSFRTYVQSRGNAKGALRDFIADAKSDARFPNIKTWGELRSYLNGRDAPHEAMVAARAIWKEFEGQ